MTEKPDCSRRLVSQGGAALEADLLGSRPTVETLRCTKAANTQFPCDELLESYSKDACVLLMAIGRVAEEKLTHSSITTVLLLRDDVGVQRSPPS